MIASAPDAVATGLEFRILGPLEVRRHCVPLEVGPHKQRALLALLLLSANHVASADRLIEELWAGRPPSGAAKTLRSYVSRLRAALGDDVVRSQPPGYVLEMQPTQLDARRFESLLGEALEARDRGDTSEAASSLREGLALWRGGALADLVDEPFAVVEAGRLEELRLVALEERIEADLDTGRHQELVAELEALLAEEPLRERLWGQLMVAFYRSGRQADALAAYQRARSLLADRLGLEAGHELRELEKKILRQELEPATVPTSGHGLPSGTVTLLLTDIEGSTRLVHELGEQYADVLANHRRTLREVFSRHGGVEVDTQGDGFLIVFARASDAVAAARETQEGLTTGPVRVRIGIHTGEPVPTPEGYVGVDVHRVARITSAGHGGQVLLSQATRDLLEGSIEVCDLGEHRLKDISEPQRLYQLGEEDFPPLRAPTKTSLPRQLTSFVGRERELKELARLLPETPLLTLTGVGGCGKTRLALEAAAAAAPRFPDGVQLVELAGLTQPEFVPTAVASQLGAQQNSQRPVLEVLSDLIRPQALLLLLDNCEHLLDACAELAGCLLGACPRLRILATSREPLGVPGERVYRVPPLSVEALEQTADAVRLFLERATAAGWEVDESAETLATVASICRELDGLPLALELAAARTSVLSVEEIAARLDDRFRFLRYWRRSPGTRHETLGATMAWSYDLLSEEERLLLRRLSVFAGGFTLEAAAAVCRRGDVDETLALLTRLVESSLVITERRDASTRYSMLETVRQYATERLAEADDEDETRGRHAAYFLEFAERFDVEWHMTDKPGALSWWPALEEEDNLRAALRCFVDRGIADSGLRFVCWLAWFWGSTDRISEGRVWCQRALGLEGESDPKSRALALWAAGLLSRLADDVVPAREFNEQSLQLFLELGDDLGIANGLHARAVVHDLSGDLDASRSDYQTALERFRELNRPWGVAAATHGLGQIYRDLGDKSRARSYLESALEMDTRYPAALHSLGDLELDEGNLGSAAKRYRASLALELEFGPGERVVTYCFAGLACVAAARGDIDRAGRLWGAAERLEARRGAKMNHVERVRYERVIETVAAEGAFDEAAAAGRELSLEQAIDYARALD